MNTRAIAKHYSLLTPDERFRLILAAGARGDDAEQERLVRAGRRLTLSIPDHAPHAHALDEVAKLTFLESLEDAGRYFDAFASAGSVCADSEALPNDRDPGEKSCAREGHFDVAMVAGFVPRVRVDGWKQFCDRMNMPALSFVGDTSRLQALATRLGPGGAHFLWSARNPTLVEPYSIQGRADGDGSRADG